METTSHLLESNLPSEVFIGKTRKVCCIAKLSFDKGFINWTIDGQAKAAVPLNNDKVLYFDSFFGFVDYVDEINSVCQAWVHAQQTMARIDLLADLFKAYFPWSKFVLGCNSVEQPKSPTLKYSEFGSESFVRYLRQILPVQSLVTTMESGLTSMRYFLHQFLDKTAIGSHPTINLTPQELLSHPEFDMEKLDAAVKLFYHRYVNEWMAKLRLVCQPTDKNDVPTAILIADRCNLSALAVHRYLVHVETMSTPEKQKELVREARVARYQMKP